MTETERELLLGNGPSTNHVGFNGGNQGGIQRADSHYSAASSEIIIGVEKCRQRYKKLLPESTGDAGGMDEKDYKTLVHTIHPDKLAAILKTSLSDGHKCSKGAAGLKQIQADRYLEAYGKNQITPPKRENKWIKLLKQTFLGIFNILLWSCVGAEIALIIIFRKPPPPPDPVTGKLLMPDGSTYKDDSDYVTPIVLSAVIVSAAILQWWTEMKAESMMEALQKMQSAEKVNTVRRDTAGGRVDVDVDPIDLVPGDIIFIEAGMRIPADVRIMHCTDGMEVDNSALTGESVPEPRVVKTEPPTVSPTEAHNVAFFGTTVLKGSATCMVHATGDNTFLGKIAAGIKGSRTLSTLEIQIEHFVHIIAVVAIVIGILSLISNLCSPVKRGPSDILENSATALFAQVPEGLLPTVTISLMIASQKMSERKVLIRKLDAVETLGCVSVICSDKTGTLTTGEMATVDLVTPTQSGDCEVVTRRSDGTWDESKTREPRIQNLALCGCLNNGAKLGSGQGSAASGAGANGVAANLSEDDAKITGSPTEVAIMRASVACVGGGAKATQLRFEYANVFEIPFNSENKWMITIHVDPKANGNQQSGPFIGILKGAPERVFTYCKMSGELQAKVEQKLANLMANGRRVLCLAKREYKGSDVPAGGKFNGSNASDVNFPMKDFQFAGLFGIEDPPKQGVADSVVSAQDAGVKVVMVTGDHPDTARAIAGRINILDLHQLDQEGSSDAATFAVIPGSQLDGRLPKGEGFSHDDHEEVKRWWMKAVQHTRVFARVSPIHKQVIVQAYQFFGNNFVGEICAMTGDGVNDAPALKQAEVGVAMGIRGTEVAKDAADIILLDDNFTSIVAGMEQGRLSSENLQKSIMYTLCSKVPQVSPTFAELIRVPQALTVAQVLLIDIGTDIWTAIAYAVQPAESRLMQRPPRHPREEKMVNWKVLVYSYGYIGQLQQLCCWVMFFHATPGMWQLYMSGHTHDKYTDAERFCNLQGMTVYYWTLVMGQIAAAISTTTKAQSVFGIGQTYGFPNTTLNWMFVLEVVTGLVAIYWGPMQGAFKTAWLPLGTLLEPVWAFVFICAVEEIRKVIARSMEEGTGEKRVQRRV